MFGGQRYDESLIVWEGGILAKIVKLISGGGGGGQQKGGGETRVGGTRDTH